MRSIHTSYTCQYGQGHFSFLVSHADVLRASLRFKKRVGTRDGTRDEALRISLWGRRMRML